VERFDAIVVGAGPAGSATALRLARGGARVLLADKKRFPRDKACGGGLTGRAVRELPCDVSPVVEDVVYRFELRLRYRKRLERRSESPLVLMTRRRRLDAFMAEQAAAAGADFRDGVTVEGLTLGPDGAELTVGGVRVAAPVLVGADGANGMVARNAGLGGGILYGIALEGNGPLRPGRQGLATVEVGVVPGGYGWVFPKDGHANYGVGGWSSEGPRLRAHLRRLCLEHGINADELTDLHGTRLPMRRTARISAGPVLLVGDAAGLVDPLSGDGIHEALVSARLAAEAILAGQPETYEPALDAALGRQAATSWKAKLVLDRHPRVAFEAMRLPKVWDVIAGLLTGEVAHPSEARGLARPSLRLLARL
jgi:geranylgeranyl reductase family protein